MSTSFFHPQKKYITSELIDLVFNAFHTTICLYNYIALTKNPPME